MIPYRVLLLTLLSGVLFFGISGGDYWFSHHLGKWAVLMGALSILISAKAWEFAHWSVGLFIGVVLLGSIRTFGWTFVDRDSVYTGFALAMFGYFFSGLDRSYRRTVIQFMAIVCGASTLMTLSQFSIDPYYRAAFSGNASMNGCLIAITFPAFCEWVNRQMSPKCQALINMYFGGLAAIAVYMTDASIPVGVVCVVLGAWVLAYTPKLLAGASVSAAIAALFLSIGYLLQPSTFLASSGRFGWWKDVLAWWWSSDSRILGVGTGTGKTVFQAKWVNAEGSAQWAHNDWLQLLFENGILGVASGLALLYFALKKSRSRPWLFAAISGYAATAFFNYPVHLPIHALVGVSLVWLAHIRDEASL